MKARQPRKRLAASGGPREPGPSGERWLLSYADFMTLLLALFVVLYASARVEENPESNPFEGLQAAFVFDENSPTAVQTTSTAPGSEPATEETLAPLPVLAQLEEALADVIDEIPREPGEDPGISLHSSEEGLTVSLSSTEFFPAGGVEIPEARKAALAAMVPLLNSTSASLRFEGHTDSQPIGAGPYPSNWELSSARAAAVARFFMTDHALSPARVSTVGFADQRPMADDEDPANRARNRRVDIVILADGALVPKDPSAQQTSELDQLLEALPPIPQGADESLRVPDAGPQPLDIPLP